MLSLSAAALLLLGTSAGQQRQAWKQDVFAIGSFLDPPATDHFYGQFRAANFTVMLSTYTTNASTMAAQAAMCEAHGLKCILSGPTSQFPKRGPAMHDCKGRVDPAHLFEPAAGGGALPSHVWGYYLWDEPYENRTDQPRLDMYEWLKSIQDAVHSKQPEALVYINGGDGSSESTAFDAAYDKAVLPDVYSFDFYPSFGGMINNVSIHDTRGVQLRLLEDARLVSQARGVPLWNWFAGAGSIGVPYGTGGPGCLSDQSEQLPCNFVDITRAQFFWQAWTSLAFGSRGLFEYFYYQDPAHFHCRTFMRYPGMLRSDGSESEHYEDAQQVNSVVMALAPTLMQVSSSVPYEDDPFDFVCPAMIVSNRIIECDSCVRPTPHTSIAMTQPRSSRRRTVATRTALAAPRTALHGLAWQRCKQLAHPAHSRVSPAVLTWWAASSMRLRRAPQPPLS